MSATNSVPDRQANVEAGNFVRAMSEHATKKCDDGKLILDSATAAEFISDGLSRNDVKVPETMQAILDDVKGPDQIKISRVILDAAANYEYEHGRAAPNDFLAHLMHVGASVSTANQAKNKLYLDAATSGHHDQLSLQPNRLVLAILWAAAEPIPFANYLAPDIRSNQAKAAIIGHKAKSKFGRYDADGSMDGGNLGAAYFDCERIDRVVVTGSTGNIPAGQITSIQATDNTCLPVASGAVAVNLLRGRTQVYINGTLAAFEPQNTSGSGNSTLAGSVTINGTTHNITGTINTDTGAHQVTCATLPIGTEVYVMAYIDFERQPSLAPGVYTDATVFDYFARPLRGNTQASPDAINQMANELGLDPTAEALVTIQNQVAMERHYKALQYLAMEAAANAGVSRTFDMSWSTQGQQKTRSQIMEDARPTVWAISQAMAEATLGFGVSHMYVERNLMSIMQGMPTSVWRPSGIQARPGIYRLGTWMDTIEVYYTPRHVAGSTSSATALMIGVSPDSARNPVVMGDSSAPIIRPLGEGLDQVRGFNFWGNHVLSPNKHEASSRAAALMTITNMSL